MKRTSLVAMLVLLACNMTAQSDASWQVPGMFTTGRYLYAAQKDGLYRLEQTMAAIPVQWELVAFAGVPISQAVIKGDSIIASTMLEGPDSLLLLSTDGGKSYIDYTPIDLWLQNRIDNALPLRPCYMTSSPVDANILVMSVHNSGVYQSTDFGKTWSLLPNIPPGTFVSFNPNDGRQLFSCYESMAMCGEIGMSIDGGVTWERVLSQSAAFPKGIAFHLTDEKHMFAYGMGICATSIDQGYTWVNHQGHLSGELEGAVFSAAVYDNISSNTIYAVDSDGHDVTIYKSNDDGYSWTMIEEAHPENGVGTVGGLYLMNRILYVNTADGGILSFDLDENPDNSISLSTSGNPSVAYYDLCGRIVTHPTRGIYIKNGKKICF